MSIVILEAIYEKIRFLTSSGTSLQLKNPQLGDAVDSFYNYDLPAEFRSLKLKDVYIFTTSRGIDTYPFDSEHYTTIQGPVLCAKKPIALYYDSQTLFNNYYNQQYRENFATGDGTIGPYASTTQNNPILRSYNNDPGPLNNPILTFPQSRVQNILITANSSFGVTQNVTDDGQGNLIQILPYTGTPQYGPSFYSIPAGTIDYETGNVSNLTFNQAIPSGNSIQIQYLPALVNTPLSIAFSQNQFTLRPCPDQGYAIEMIAYRRPTQALKNTPANLGVPELSEWWELIAVGAAKKIFENRLDSDGIMLMDKMLKERYSVAEARTYAQIGKEQIYTIYSDQLNSNNACGAGNWLFPSS